MSIQGALIGNAEEGGVGYGGRLGINFDTPITLDVALERPRFDNGLGTSIAGAFAYEIYDYEPSVCPYAGVRYERIPRALGQSPHTFTTIPIGLGFGKRLGSARLLSLALFAMPEFVYVVNGRDDPGLVGAFFDELSERSEGRGTLGLIAATPLIYATGSVRVTTFDPDSPVFSLGVGMTF